MENSSRGKREQTTTKYYVLFPIILFNAKDFIVTQTYELHVCVNNVEALIGKIHSNSVLKPLSKL